MEQVRVTVLSTHMNGWQDDLRRRPKIAGTADGGLWKSIDGGDNWEALYNFVPSLAVGALDVLPGSDLVSYSNTTIYLGTRRGESLAARQGCRVG